MSFETDVMEGKVLMILLADGWHWVSCYGEEFEGDGDVFSCFEVDKEDPTRELYFLEGPTSSVLAKRSQIIPVPA